MPGHYLKIATRDAVEESLTAKLEALSEEELNVWSRAS